MAVRLKVNIELPYDPEGPLLGLSPVKARIKKKQEEKAHFATTGIFLCNLQILPQFRYVLELVSA